MAKTGPCGVQAIKQEQKVTNFLPAIKQITCLLSCYPADLDSQLPTVLECLRAAFCAQAVGLFKPISNNSSIPQCIAPENYPVSETLRKEIMQITEPIQHYDRKTGHTWLATPMKNGGTTTGYLYALGSGRRDFNQQEFETLITISNHIAMAFENSRLHSETQQLAAQRGELLRRIIANQDERCRRISRELHDEISQSLTAMALDIEAVEIADLHSKDNAMDRLRKMRPRLLAAIEEINRIILDLRPTLLEDRGLMAAISWFAFQRLQTLGIEVFIESEPESIRFEPHVETTLYRIAQEAINNIARHAGAKHVWLSLKQSGGQSILTIQDDGCGFNPHQIQYQANRRIGMGLFSMRERAAIIEAQIQIISEREKGTRIIVKYPRGSSKHDDEYKEHFHATDPCTNS